MSFNISEHSKNKILSIARAAVSDALTGKNTINDFIGDIPEDLQYKGGCFVTIHDKPGNLRGCIGNFRDDVEIVENVRINAVHAAFEDPRFKPVDAGELDDISFEISLLSPMIQIGSVDEIKVGRDGLYVVKGMNRGVLLPQVASEYGWDAVTFLSQTCVKAGLKADTWKNGNLDIYRFEALVFSEAETR